MTKPYEHPLPEPGDEERDRGHHLCWISVVEDPMYGAVLQARITRLKGGGKMGRGKVVRVNRLQYEWARKHGKPLAYYLPPTGGQIKQSNKLGDRFRMPSNKE